jgi:DNA-binding CsgD family transcriptional regulator
MGQLTRQHLSQALRLISEAGAFVQTRALVQHAVTRLPELVGSELTTLSDCDLAKGTRHVVSFPNNAISSTERACFDQFIHQHPLVQFHSQWTNQRARRISDCLPMSWFRRTDLYNEYYRRVGIGHVVALPLITGRNRIVSFVLNRERRNFGERDMQMLDLLRPGLATLYGRALQAETMRDELADMDARLRRKGVAIRGLPDGAALTPREQEVLMWLGRGKSNAQIAAILATSPRTVQKHLERIFEKLGVENRTAAVLRMLQSAGEPTGFSRSAGGMQSETNGN